MPAASDRLEFAPPQTPGLLRSFGLAVLAHILLLVALTWGVSWKRESDNLAVEAELWASVPQQTAPKLVETPPPPKVIEPPKPPPPVVKQPDINIEREKKRPEPVKKVPPKVEPKPEPVKKPVEDLKKKQALEAKAKAEDEAKRLEQQRQENLKRMTGLAGASGTPDAKGAATQSAGPSAGYAGRIRARVKPNIVFTDAISGNPTAEVEVRTAPDGTIVGRKLIKSSGVKSWDEAVLKAIDKTEILPRDIDGRVPSALIISFRPKD